MGRALISPLARLLAIASTPATPDRFIHPEKPPLSLILAPLLKLEFSRFRVGEREERGGKVKKKESSETAVFEQLLEYFGYHLHYMTPLECLNNPRDATSPEKCMRN